MVRRRVQDGPFGPCPPGGSRRRVGGRMGSKRAGIPVIGAVVFAAAALALPSGAGTPPAAWQYQAIGTSAVPPAVLRAAASLRLAVIHTGADLSAPDLAPRHPLTYD